jgi:hypothetical protein
MSMTRKRPLTDEAQLALDIERIFVGKAPPFSEVRRHRWSSAAIEALRLVEIAIASAGCRGSRRRRV